MSVKRMAIVLALLSLVASQPAVSASGETVPLATIAALEVPRYMGRWYEIAKYPNWFQK
jgi:apolipoprotein D and lipocalin family protein